MKALLSLVCVLLFLDGSSYDVRAQSRTANPINQATELLYIFSYPVVGRTYVMGMYNYETEDLYLPVVELFGHFEVNMELSRDKNTLSGIYLLEGKSYTIDATNYKISLGEKTWELSEDLMYRQISDIYLHSDVYEEIFNLSFEGDVNRLMLSLETSLILPVIELNNRKIARSNIQDQQFDRTFYTMRFDREYDAINGGMFDYNLGVITDVQSMQPSYNFQYITGLEVLGGQFRGRFNSLYSNLNGWQHAKSNYDWEFNLRESPFLSKVMAGHISTRGFNVEPVLGLGITNQPIEPRQMFGYTYVDGTTEPDSEVELFLNNQLIDYTRADAQGYYRLDVPLRYGTTKVRVQVYTPNGQLKTEEQELQIPYSFAPKGVMNYQLYGGMIRDEMNDPFIDKRFAGSVDFNYGLTRWLTVNAGYSESNNIESASSLFSGFSARLFNTMLLDFEYVPDVWYRSNASLVFGGSSSVSSTFTKYSGISVMNTKNAEYSMINNVFYTLPFESLNLGLRLSGITYGYMDGVDTRFSGDLFTQLGRINLRFNYSDTYSITDGALVMGRNMDSYKITGTYSFAGVRAKFLKSTYLRGSALFSEEFSRLDQVDLQFSRKILKTGRFNVNFSNSFLTNSSFIQVGFNFNLSNWARASSNMRTDFNSATLQQRVRGSIGVDHRNRYLEFTDRQQVGRSAATVIMFLDNDENGEYTSGDDLIPYKAVDLDRSGSVTLGKDGLVRLSHLQSNYRYNLSIDRKAIPNPLLVPDSKFKEFSFVADPNQFKRIEIPFYQAGVIEGMVVAMENNVKEGVGGLRLTLNSLQDNFSTTLRTYRGGSFYAMDIPPGKYALSADPLQLDMLGYIQESGAFEVEVRKVANGDFVQGIEIILTPSIDPDEGVRYNGNSDALTQRQQVFEEELRFDMARALTYFTSAQNSYYLQRYERALDYIENSLDLFVTPHSLSIKGSILYSMGDQSGAAQAWREAERMDPDILLPNASQTLLND